MIMVMIMIIIITIVMNDDDNGYNEYNNRGRKKIMIIEMVIMSMRKE